MGFDSKFRETWGAKIWKCAVCFRPSNRRCDFRLVGGTVCDKPLCSSCTVSAGPGIDHCPGHPQRQAAQASP